MTGLDIAGEVLTDVVGAAPTLINVIEHLLGHSDSASLSLAQEVAQLLPPQSRAEMALRIERARVRADLHLPPETDGSTTGETEGLP